MNCLVKNFICRSIIILSHIGGGISRRFTQMISEYKLTSVGVQYKAPIVFYGKGEFYIHPDSQVSIGEHFVCSSGQKYPIDNRVCSKVIVKQGASLTIGSYVGISNVCIHCHESVTIGDHVNIGAGTMIFDTDFHSLDWNHRKSHTDIENRKTKPVRIGELVFIGANCIILKGAEIGDKSIIGAGSVVACKIPAGEIWAGNPAKFIKKIQNV